jgi:hypothetical protein
VIRIMRNISVRLWLTVLFAVPAGFYFMPWITRSGSGPGMMGFFFFFAGVCYGCISLLMHLAGIRMIQKRIQEAEVWERAGIPARAEKKYLQAVRIYDSFLLSPIRSKKMTSRITRALARFALTFDRKYGDFSRAVQVYLASAPHDEALATLWLQQVCRDKIVTTQDQALLTRLARYHSGNPGLLGLLTLIFLDSRRMDFTARQIYAQVMEDPGLKHRFQKNIEVLTGTPPEPIPTVHKQPVQKGRKKRASTGKISEARPFAAWIWKSIPGWVGRTRSGVAAAYRSACAFIGRLNTAIGRQIKWRFYLKAGFMGLLCVGLAVFVYHTISYLKTPEPVAKTEIVIKESVPKPFTIQVAAYLADSHARDYVALLTRQGVDARIKKTTAGGKTWYLIHVSEFETRKTAAMYGNQLKSEHIIEEFFVTNKK